MILQRLSWLELLFYGLSEPVDSCDNGQGEYAPQTRETSYPVGKLFQRPGDTFKLAAVTPRSGLLICPLATLPGQRNNEAEQNRLKI